ncbi:hypothetical protein [Spirillospora sp. CA-128828]|uniref:hypothetical protein n=1 Tax=Spirillospora sp. CA-128828 TaxID=3240033 RepID=UPI003D944A10
MTIVTWTKPVRRRINSRYVETGQRAPLKVHVSLDGVRTMCGHDIPDHAAVTATTADWHLHTNCYNCAYRLWPTHAPDGYICPSDSHDFPIRRKPPVHTGPPCPKCGEQHPLNETIPPCALNPPSQRPADQGRCSLGACESTALALRHANPELQLDLPGILTTHCHHCGHEVCTTCQTRPVDRIRQLCEPCRQLDGTAIPS